jgi:DNA polymerase (family 10)
MGWSGSLKDIMEESGRGALVEIPHIGPGIAAAIDELVHTGGWSQLDRLRGTLDPVKLFQAIPGVGPELACRLHETLHVDTLEALEVAAHDGRVREVPGVGPRRAAGLRAALAAMLGRLRWRPEKPRRSPTAMHSNTARAYDLERTQDWVVVYFYDDHHVEGQQTVVTETRGPLSGRRVVRGREAECRAYYGAAPG